MHLLSFLYSVFSQPTHSSLKEDEKEWYSFSVKAETKTKPSNNKAATFIIFEMKVCLLWGVE
jgi:hypothetical protein